MATPPSRTVTLVLPQKTAELMAFLNSRALNPVLNDPTDMCWNNLDPERPYFVISKLLAKSQYRHPLESHINALKARSSFDANKRDLHIIRQML